MSLAALFPGQGSQFVGMGSDLFESRPDLLGERADDIVGFSLRTMCLEGPEEELTRTEHAQPALFALSYALWDDFSRAGFGPVAAAAGHSLGEYTALAAAGCFDFDTALSLVTLRGRVMAEAAGAGRSGMAALLGPDPGTVEEICSTRRAAGGRLQLANLNAPGQVVVAGASEDIGWLAENAKDLGVRRVIPLSVSGAFHSDYMEPARPALEEALAGAEVSAPEFPVWANPTARPHRLGEIRETLSRQLVEPVRFSDTLLDMAAEGVDVFVHVGPGDVTAGLARRTVEGSRVVTVSALVDIPEALAVIGTMTDH